METTHPIRKTHLVFVECDELARLVDEKDAVEDVHRLMSVHRRHDLSDPAQIAIDEVAQAAIVIDRAGAGATTHVKLESRDAERVLHVDGDQADSHLVIDRREVVWADFLTPGEALARELSVPVRVYLESRA